MSENNEAYIFSPNAMRELDRFMRSVSGLIDQKITAALGGRPTTFEKEIRIGTTVGYDPTAYDGSGEEDPIHYPDQPANTFWVKLGAPSYTKTAGNQTLTITHYDPPVYRLCYSASGYIEEGTVVWLKLLHGQYYVMSEGGAEDASEVGQGILLNLITNYDGKQEAEIEVTVAPCSNPSLLGQVITVIDHSECIFDRPEGELMGVWCWFAKGHTELEGCHWIAQDRCCVEADLS